tara:strand:- start:88 stop:456 length:369 start_codon:yes stop_codon:yes gene_type:complete
MIIQNGNTVNLNSAWNISSSRENGIHSWQESYFGTYTIYDLEVCTISGSHKSGGYLNSFDTSDLSNVYYISAYAHLSNGEKDTEIQNERELHIISNNPNNIAGQQPSVLTNAYPWNVIEANQ